MQTYPVVETFYSFQGEGLFMGSAAFFVRLWGCPVKCAWCDTKSSWLEKPDTLSQKTAEELANLASLSSCEFAVITGGEPTLHDLIPLQTAFKNLQIPLHLETSGFLPKDENLDFDWITLSPKLHSKTHESFLESADEMKFIISSPEEIEIYADRFSSYIKGKKAVFLTPEFSKSNDVNLLEEITEAVKLYGAPFRVGCQLHKFYNAQ